MKNKILFIVLGICTFLLIVTATTLAIIRRNVNAYLIDGNTVSIRVNTEYHDPGLIIKSGKKKVDKLKYDVKVTGKYNTTKLGMYKIDYHTKYFNKSFDLTRIIKVYDDVKPELTVNLDKVEIDYCTKKYKQELKTTAIDNYDGDISSLVTTKEEDDKLYISVTDSSNNTEIKEIPIDYGNKPSNKFALNGSSKIYVVINGKYEEQGASYVDGCGKKIDKKINITGEVDTSVLGEYKVTYEVSGEEPITRTVIVREKPNKTIYLTFDDGPGKQTKNVLDTLDKYNVKATFFVTNQFSSYQYLIKTEHDKGHAVGVHTLTHSWNIYDSLDAYVDDFNAMNEIVKNQTGSYTKLFRFPGGSGNTVSKSHKAGVVTEIANYMTEKGYVYFDWNLSSGDADKKASTDKIINNVLNKVDNCSNKCVILFHDYKSITANAIDPILKELVARGYDFDTLSESGPIVHANIKN